MLKMRIVVSLASAAIRVAVQMVGQLNDGPRADPGRTKRLFDRLKWLIRALPPSRHLSEKLQENLDCWPRQWEQGEYSAARYQMVMLVRKLRKYRDEWAADVPAKVKPTPPQLSSFAVAMQG